MDPIDLNRYRLGLIQRLTDGTLDVLVIGGGIVGAGIARDAAMRRLRVGLVEQHDLAFGTSSRSSRLLHGGIRYLAQGRLGLVRQSSREKRLLHRIAPHLAQPLPFVFPTYRRTRWPLWKLRLGVKLYDLLCGRRNLGPSSSFSPAGLLKHLPGVEAANLTGAVRYYDALTNDARLVIDTLRSAARQGVEGRSADQGGADRSGAVVCNYTRLEDASPDARGWQCLLRDLIADRTYGVSARTVVNATGPWAQTLPHGSVGLRLTKGVHLVIDRRRLSVPDAVVMTEDRRILFAVPWGERVILGTTDTDYSGPIEAVRSGPADVDYILEVTNRTFPAAGLGPSDVISTWAGLRALLATGRGRPSDVSRAHRIRMPRPGWLDVAGGKLTTYRLIAQHAVDRLLGYLGRSAPSSRTAEEPLLPLGDAEGASGVLPPPVTAEVVEHYCRREWAVHLDDVMRRRTSWHYYHTDAPHIARRTAGWMGQIFGWDDGRREAELAGYGGPAPNLYCPPETT